jgi:hypothetical protein
MRPAQQGQQAQGDCEAEYARQAVFFRMPAIATVISQRQQRRQRNSHDEQQQDAGESNRVVVRNGSQDQRQHARQEVPEPAAELLGAQACDQF